MCRMAEEGPPGNGHRTLLDVIQASAAELERHLSNLFRDDEAFGFAFQLMTTWDDPWKLVQTSRGSCPGGKGNSFTFICRPLLRQKVAGVFRLSSLDKPTLCKAAILTRLDLLDFRADLQATMEEHGQASGFSAFALVMASGGTSESKSSAFSEEVTRALRPWLGGAVVSPRPAQCLRLRVGGETGCCQAWDWQGSWSSWSQGCNRGGS